MALDLTKLKANFAALVATAPQTITVGAATANCLRTELQADKRQNEYGGTDTYSFSVMIAESALVSWPADGDTVQINSATYRVLKVTQDPLGTSRRIDLGGHYG
jgi:hypothetical protein